MTKELPDPEIRQSANRMIEVAIVGVLRQTENIQLGRKEKDPRGKPWQTHIEGCLGEAAFAEYLGVFWSGAHRFRAEDVRGYEVFTTPKHSNKLIVNLDDERDCKWVLVTGCNGCYVIRGWFWAVEAKQEKYWWEGTEKPPRPAYYVPQCDLYPFTPEMFHALHEPSPGTTGSPMQEGGPSHPLAPVSSRLHDHPHVGSVRR